MFYFRTFPFHFLIKENEKVVSAFLSSHKSFDLIAEKTTFPSADGGDGFYYAVMVKNEN